MPISRVILNASPIICLMKAGLIEILPAVFKEILVPQEVKREIFVKGATNLNEEVLTSCQWIGIVGDITIAPQVASWRLLTSGP
jgi:predicted nucleic acid-binding protein